ncbi:MAG: putative selenium-dependent hydroxylase accessory protein YqeC [Spirochaetales bacterium]|nr:putative selenium-dependent hydroxylase accessory protein YqeC [Spirochaetales bacterium]
MAFSLFTELGACLDSLVARRIAVTGSGGKTSIIIGLADYFKEEGVLITTTTKLASPIDMDYPFDEIVTDPACPPKVGRNRQVLWAAQGADKLESVDQVLLEEASKAGGYTLIEADGARGRPFAFHNEGEPVIPPWVDCIIAVVGLGGIGKRLDEETFHREREYRAATGSTESWITLDTLDALLNHPDGILKGTAAHPVILVYNQSDATSDAIVAEALRLGHAQKRITAVLAGTCRGGL